MILAAYDLGTTGCKTSFFDEQGPLLGSAYREYPTYYPKEGWAEQDPADWKRELIRTTAQLIEQTGVRPGDVACLSFSGHMMGCVPVDERGETLSSRTMLWADTRSVEQAERLVEKIGWERFYRETGSGLDVVLYPAAKIPWIKENQPDLYRRAAKFIGTKDAICAWLTGRIATDYSEASDIGLLHLGERCWHEELLQTLGIDPGKMPELLPSTTVIGHLRREVATEMGLVEGTPVVLGGGDVSCGTAGGWLTSGSVTRFFRQPVLREKQLRSIPVPSLAWTLWQLKARPVLGVWYSCLIFVPAALPTTTSMPKGLSWGSAWL